MSQQMEKVIECFRRVAEFAAVSGAAVVSSLDKTSACVNSKSLGIITSWTQRNLERKTNMTSDLFQSVDLNTGKVLTLGPAIDTSGQLMSSYSPSGRLRAVLRETQASQKDPKTQYIEIWSSNTMVHQFDLNKYSLHGDVYANNAEFGCFEWSKCENKILYTAEKKLPKTASFLAAKPKKSGDEEEIIPGNEYLLNEDWGEQLVEKASPILAVADISTSEVKLVLSEGNQKDLVISSGVWAPNEDGIIAVQHDVKPRRLGKIYCSNRKSKIVHINPSKSTVDNLSDENKAVSSPRVSPDGSKVVWMETEAGGPHLTCHRLMILDWNLKKRRILVDVVKQSASCSGGQQFFGLYNMFILDSAWLSDNKTLIVNSPQRCSVNVYAINTDTGVVTEVIGSDEWSHSLLKVHGNVLICSKSSLTHYPGVIIAEAEDLSNLKWFNLVEPKRIEDNYSFEVKYMCSSNKEDTVRDYNYIYFGPKEGKNVPLIVWSHGGPHSVFPNNYNMEAHFFAKVGMAMVIVNYRGSIGSGKDSVDWLLGKVGSSDIADVHNAALDVLDSVSLLDRNRVLALGGSHGGFISLHLIGQYPLFYCAASIRNPVASISDLATLSDIPDWAFAESGINPYSVDNPRTLSGEEVNKMTSMSPIRYVKDVKASVLMVLGKKDLRVPHYQGLNYYYGLKANGVANTKLLMYDDNHSIRQSANETDVTINTALWFLNENI